MKIATMTPTTTPPPRVPLPISRRTCAAPFVRAALFIPAALLIALLFDPPAHGADAKPSMQSIAIELFASLNPAQRQRAVVSYDNPERDGIQYTGGARAGVSLKDLDARQRELAMSLLKRFTSDYGAKKCDEIAAQDADEGGMDKYFVAFFGEPGEGKTYAWRFAEHHLTLVHMEVEKGEPAQFGPILLGADPPTLWDAEEDQLIALYAAMSEQERAKSKREGAGVASNWMDKDIGIRVADLSPTAQEKLKIVFEHRLKFFSEEIQARIRKIVDAGGGLDAMRVAFWGVADKRCRDGGKWDFKLGNASFLCDYENSRRHIHLSMKGKLVEK